MSSFPEEEGDKSILAVFILFLGLPLTWILKECFMSAFVACFGRYKNPDFTDPDAITSPDIKVEKNSVFSKLEAGTKLR